MLSAGNARHRYRHRHYIFGSAHCAQASHIIQFAIMIIGRHWIGSDATYATYGHILSERSDAEPLSDRRC